MKDSARTLLAALLLAVALSQSLASPTGAQATGQARSLQDAQDSVLLRSGELLTDRVESIEEDLVRLGSGGALLRDEVRWIAYGHSDTTWLMPDPRPLDQVLLRNDTWLEGRVISANRRRLVLDQGAGENRLIAFDDLAGVAFCDAPGLEEGVQPPDPAADPQGPSDGASGLRPPSDQPAAGGGTVAGGRPPWFNRDSGADCGPGGPTTYCNWNLEVPGVCTFTAQGCGLNINIVKPGWRRDARLDCIFAIPSCHPERREESRSRQSVLSFRPE